MLQAHQHQAMRDAIGPFSLAAWNSDCIRIGLPLL
jgi:hypothetical protein